MLKTACALAIGIAASSAFAADVGVSIHVGDPSYYGRIDIGNVPQPPRIIYAQPVYIQRPPAGDDRPIYLRVPRGYEKHWEKHCHAYDACNRPVYFVREDWYRQHYLAGRRGTDGHDWGRDHDRRGEFDRRRGDDHRGDRHRGRGEDRGHGHGREGDD